jgi:nucleoside-diphosphate-sugar epimerase
VPLRQALRWFPSPWQVLVLDGLLGALAYTLAMIARFVPEEAVPQTYAVRAVLWAAPAALLQVGVGEVMSCLRRPRSPLARRPVLPFLVAIGLGLLVLVIVNDGPLMPLAWRLPHFVVLFGPLLAGAGSAALRLTANRPFDPAELLPRRSVRLDLETCGAALGGKRILITGAAGSIGAELARQVFLLRPAKLVIVDVNETGLYELESVLVGGPVKTCIADVADGHHLRRLFEQERPQIVFHAAAYKHVPLLETNPAQGFVANVLGTLNVCEAAASVGAERVVVISTDKAVNPSSFMGLTKRVAELIVAAMGQRAEQPVFSAVRFGNVLGSRGSVVPTLLRQIDAGGPITITHPDAQRFFMTVSEAASLVLTAAMGQPGGIFVLDMGDALRIEDLAERLVRLRGLRPGRDITVEYIGLRPGEKLREELSGDGETLVPTQDPYVRRVHSAREVDGPTLLGGVRALDEQRLSGHLDAGAYPSALRALIESAVRPSTEPVLSS